MGDFKKKMLKSQHDYTAIVQILFSTAVILYSGETET